MEKSTLTFLIGFFLIVISFHFVNGEEDPSDVRGVIAREFNISLDKVPTDRGELERMYLQQEWTEVVANSSTFGPIHKFFSKDGTQIAFQALFAHKYELSLTFFLILVFWIFIWFIASGILESSGFVRGVIAVVSGGLIAVILAQVRFINLITEICLSFLFKSVDWWIRAIILIIILGIFAFVYVVTKMIEQNMKKNNKEKLEQNLKQNLKEVEALNKGVRGK